MVAGTRPLDFGNNRYEEGFVWSADGGFRGIHARSQPESHSGLREGEWFEDAAPDFAPVPTGDAVLGFLIGTELWREDEATPLSARKRRCFGRPAAAIVGGFGGLARGRSGRGDRGRPSASLRFARTRERRAPRGHSILAANSSRPPTPRTPSSLSSWIWGVPEPPRLVVDETSERDYCGGCGGFACGEFDGADEGGGGGDEGASTAGGVWGGLDGGRSCCCSHAERVRLNNTRAMPPEHVCEWFI